MRYIKYILLLATLVTAACSSEFRVEDIGEKIEKGTQIDGVPFRKIQPYKMSLYEKTDTGYKILNLKKDDSDDGNSESLVVLLPDPKRLYVLKFNGQMLADTTADFTLDSNGTLKSIGVTNASKVDELINEIGVQAKSIATAKKTLNDAKLAKEEARKTGIEEESKKVLSDAQQQVTYREELTTAVNSLELAQATQTILAADASLLEIIQARQNVENAKRKVNKQRVLLGLPILYPEVELSEG